MRSSKRRALGYLEHALAALRPLGRRRAASQKTEEIVSRLAEVDPPRALRVARTIPTNHARERGLALRWAAEAVARRDVDACLALLEEVTDATQRTYGMGSVVWELAQRDPAAALSLLPNLSEDVRPFYRSEIVGPLDLVDRARARREFRRLEDPLFRVRALEGTWRCRREAGEASLATAALREWVDELKRLPPDRLSREMWYLVETGHFVETFEILDAQDPLPFWPQPYLEKEFITDFRRMLRFDLERTLAAVDRVVGEDADTACGIASVALWSRSPKRARACLDRITNPEMADDARASVVREIARRRPEEAAALMRERPTAQEAMDRLWRVRDWLRIGTDEAEVEAMATARAIRHSGYRAWALAESAGTLWTRRPRLARRLLAEAGAIVATSKTRRTRDGVRENLVIALSDWPAPVAEEGIRRAEAWAARCESPRSAAECLVTLADAFEPINPS